MSGFFAPEAFRRRILRAYRIVGIATLAILAIAGLDVLGVLGEGEWPEPFYTLSVLFMFGLAFACIPGFFIATIGGVVLAREWKVALPLWLFVAASLAMVGYQWLGAEDQLLMQTSAFLLATSAVAAVWSGWTQRETRDAPQQAAR